MNFDRWRESISCKKTWGVGGGGVVNRCATIILLNRILYNAFVYACCGFPARNQKRANIYFYRAVCNSRIVDDSNFEYTRIIFNAIEELLAWIQPLAPRAMHCYYAAHEIPKRRQKGSEIIFTARPRPLAIEFNYISQIPATKHSSRARALETVRGEEYYTRVFFLCTPPPISHTCVKYIIVLV